MDRKGSVGYGLNAQAFESKEMVVPGLLKSIKVDKSLEPEGFYPRSLREARGEIAGAFAKIFASSLATGQFQEDWRVDNFVPLFKSRENPVNYRLVSLTSVVEKLWERILWDRIYSHL